MTSSLNMTFDAWAWGNPARHYAARSHANNGTQPATVPADWLAILLESIFPELRHRVERCYRQWNLQVREVLKAETALRLSVGDDAKAVPVRVVNGMPKPFADVVKRLDGLEWALLNQSTLKAVVAGMHFMLDNYQSAKSKWGNAACPAQAEELGRVGKTADAWIAHLEQAKAIDAVVGIQEDVLGAYYFHMSDIHLYWVVIGLTAAALGVSPAALTVVTLAHELAHAFTHLGRDIERDNWDTDAFARTHLNIVEGLAQFYTRVVCEYLKSRMPEAMAAYEVLLARQSGPYRAHLTWTDDGERGGEVIRGSMIECRSRRLLDIADFEAAVNRYRSGMKGRRHRPHPPESR